MRLIHYLIPCTVLFGTLPRLHAELPSSKITEVKQYLAPEGYATRPWAKIFDDFYGCSTEYKNIGTGEILANNIAYYVSGDKTTATELKLVLNVNVAAKAKDAHAEFLKIAQALNIKATGKKLDEQLVEAITKGTAAEVAAESYTTKISRSDWPTGRGYELKFIIE